MDVLVLVPVAVGLLNAIKTGHSTSQRTPFSAWKYLEIGAHPVPFEVMKGLVETLPCRVSNIYGITEGGGGGTFNLYPADVLRKPGSIWATYLWRGRQDRRLSWKGTPPGQVGELIFRTDR